MTWKLRLNNRKINHKTLDKNLTETFRTPLWLWKNLIKYHPELVKGDVLDPSAGCGSLMLEIFKNNKNTHTVVDIRPEELKHWNKTGLSDKLGKKNIRIGNYLTLTFKNKYDSILTNPPFSLTMQFVEKSLKLLKINGHATFLQRLDFLASLKRAQWFKNMPLKKVIVLSKRPMWSKIDHTTFKSSDSRDYCFFAFQNGYSGKPTIEWLFIDK